MRKEYGKALFTEFSRLLRERAPEWKPVSIKSIYVFPGNKLFRWVPEEPNHCYVILVPHHRGSDDFVVELGWSRLGRFPELHMRPSFERPTRGTEMTLPEYVCRIGWLYGSRDKWWSIWTPSARHPDDPLESLLETVRPLSREEAEKAVRKPAADAVERVVTYGIPYLREWAERVSCAPLAS